jgi:hypothetical protein
LDLAEGLRGCYQLFMKTYGKVATRLYERALRIKGYLRGSRSAMLMSLPTFPQKCLWKAWRVHVGGLGEQKHSQGRSRTLKAKSRAEKVAQKAAQVAAPTQEAELYKQINEGLKGLADFSNEYSGLKLSIKTTKRTMTIYGTTGYY